MHTISRRQLLRQLAGFAAASALPACNDRGGVLPPRSDPAALEDHARVQAERAIAAATAWLWSQQHESGVFPSRVYGVFRQGQSLTPLALSTLQQIPARFDPAPLDRDARFERGFAALFSLRSETGALGLASSLADYPCYATSLLLRCLGAQRARDAAPSLAWLRSQQLRGEDGWQGHPGRGGFGMGSARRPQPPRAGHVDLSMTRRAIEGMRAVGVPADDPALREARGFVARCRAANGAYLYSPVELALNKGPRDPESDRPLGYGSATCDAWLALAALGERVGSEAHEALAWLKTHHRVDRNPGLEGGPMDIFAPAMRGYYRAGAAACFAAGGGPAGWRAALIAAIAAEQQSDGSFRNESPLQKEDDPLIATPLALQALASCLAPG